MRLTVKSRVLSKTFLPWLLVMAVFIFGPEVLFSNFHPPYLSGPLELLAFIGFGLLCYLILSFVNGAISISSNDLEDD